jgi:hypothetical protein
MTDNRIGPIEWDGNALVGWISIDGVRKRVVVDRHTIHRHAPGFSDALTWEIKRHSKEIFEKLMPFLLSTYV